MENETAPFHLLVALSKLRTDPPGSEKSALDQACRLMAEAFEVDSVWIDRLSDGGKTVANVANFDRSGDFARSPSSRRIDDAEALEAYASELSGGRILDFGPVQADGRLLGFVYAAHRNLSYA